jgi:5-methylcytosine-specific restriction endonuclease McrA
MVKGRRVTPTERVREWRKNNPEKAKASRQATYQKHREEILAQQAMYRKEHPEILKARKAKYYRLHKEAILARQATHYQETREEQLANRHQRRAHKRNAPLNDFTHAQWIEMQEHYHHRCVYCGKRAKGYLTLDHITPLSKGGSHTAQNIVPSCRSCNTRKLDRPAPILIQPVLFLANPPVQKENRKVS